jgi:uroporphyrinogen-III decarboxylase
LEVGKTVTANTTKRPENWDRLNPEQKREQRLNWLAASAQEIKFVSAEAAKNYKTKLQRLINVYQVKEPDRVPVTVSTGVAPLYAYGINYHTAIYNYEKAVQAFAEFNEEHGVELDSCSIPTIFPARVVDMLDYKLYAWPGHGIPESATGFQFNEGEYMKADEYDAFIRNPSDFWMRIYLPRLFGAFEPFRKVGPLTDIIEFPTGSLMPLGMPDVQATLQKLIDAGQELARFARIIGEFSRQVQQKGYLTPFAGNVARAPFDMLGDTLRGTQGIMKDMFRQPDKLLEALDATANLTISSILTSAGAARGFRVWFPLHKGADGWMSQSKFDTFYFPSLKKVMDALINEGYMMTLFAEGSFDTRLESFTGFPKGSVHWQFDRTDMARAKKIFGGKFSLEGNVPSSMLVTGSPREVKEHCRKLIEICGQSGGYILGGGASIGNPEVENLRAMVEAAKEYGVYQNRASAADDLFVSGY